MAPRPREMGTIELISPDGSEKKVFSEATARTKMAEGWSVAEGRGVGLKTRHADVYVDPASAQRILESEYQAAGVKPGREQIGEYEDVLREAEFGGRGLEAGLAGAARGFTLGLSDPFLTGMGLVEAETLEGLQEQNVGASLVGEFGSMVAATVATGGTSLVARGLQKTPAGLIAGKAIRHGEKGTRAFIAAQAAESALYGVGHNISQVTINNEPLTAESLVVDSLRDGLYAGAFGAAGGAAFKGAGAVAERGKKALQKSHPLFDVTTTDGHRFLDDTATHMRQSQEMGEELLQKTSPARRQISPAERKEIKLWDDEMGFIRDNLSARVAARKAKVAPDIEMPKPPKVVEKPVALEPPAGTFDAAGKAGGDVDFLLPRSGGVSREAAAEIAAKTRKAATSPEITALESELARAKAVAAKAAGKPAATKREIYKNAARQAKADGLPSLRREKSILGDLKSARLKAAKDTSLAGHMEPLEDVAKAAKVAGPSDAEYAKYTEDLAAYEASLEAAQKAAAQHADVAKGLDEMTARLKAGPTAAEVLEIKKFLGDSPQSLNTFNRKAQAQAEWLDDITRRAATPDTPDMAFARKEYEESLSALNKVIGKTPSASALGKALNGTPEEVLSFASAADRHLKAVRGLAEVTGDTKAVRASEGMLKNMQSHLEQSLTPEVLAASKHLDLGDAAGAAGLAADYAIEGGPLDSLAKVATVLSFARRGGKMAGVGKKAGAKSSAVKDVLAAGGTGSARSLVKGGGIGRAGARFVVGAAGGKLSRGAMDKLWDHSSLFRASGKANSAIAQAVQRMLGKTVKTSMGGAGAKAMLKALKFNEDAERRGKEREQELTELFKNKAEQLTKYASNPMQLAQVMHENTAGLRAAHATLGDKVEVGTGRAAQYLLERMPKDPGTQHIMGVSTWKPNDMQIQEFANVIAGVLDPIGTFDGITSGDISMQAAQAVRAVYPETFAMLQLEVAKNAVAIRETTDWETQNRLSVFMGVPVNSMNTPEYQKFIIDQYAEAQTAQVESMKNVDANALLQGTPTQAQQLLKRGTK